MSVKTRLALASVLSAFLMALGLGLTGAPAQAAPLHGCADNAICLFQWTNYGASKWQSSFFNVQNSGCINLTSPAAYWASDGAQVWDNSGSLVVNATGSWPGTTYLTVYNWASCNSGGGIASFPAHIDSTEPNLSNLPIGGGLNAYHTITSISIQSL